MLGPKNIVPIDDELSCIPNLSKLTKPIFGRNEKNKTTGEINEWIKKTLKIIVFLSFFLIGLYISFYYITYSVERTISGIDIVMLACIIVWMGMSIISLGIMIIQFIDLKYYKDKLEKENEMLEDYNNRSLLFNQ